MYDQLKILQHEHSGKYRPHEHTSYIPLFMMIIVVGVMLLAFSWKSFVSADARDPQSGSIGLTGQVPAKPPKEAATIDVPKEQQHFTTSPITVSGTCPLDTLVELYKSNIFGGSVPCDDKGKYSTQVDLLYGQNILTALVYDTLNQAGPVSNAVTVYYDVTPPANPALTFLNFGASQLLINTDAVYRGSFPGDNMNVPITLVGGAAPFAINIQWGDGTSKIVARGDNSVFNISHIYKKAGTYKLTIQATDSQNQVAFLTVAVIVNGQPAGIAQTANIQTPKKLLNKLLVLWPLFAIAATMVVSFWSGERHEKKIMDRLLARQQNPSLGVSPRLPV